MDELAVEDQSGGRGQGEEREQNMISILLEKKSYSFGIN